MVLYDASKEEKVVNIQLWVTCIEKFWNELMWKDKEISGERRSVKPSGLLSLRGFALDLLWPCLIQKVATMERVEWMSVNSESSSALFSNLPPVSSILCFVSYQFWWSAQTAQQRCKCDTRTWEKLLARSELLVRAAERKQTRRNLSVHSHSRSCIRKHRVA